MKKVLLVGSGGYGANYLDILLNKGQEIGWSPEGIVDPFASSGSLYQEVIAQKVPVYDSLEEFYAEHQADIALIATPIMHHRSQSVFCMEHDSDVLLEKPVAGSVAEAQKIADAAKRTGKKLMLGFQWCANDQMLAFKKDADEGKFGKLLSMKALVLWPRNFAYFNRGTKWAGKCYDKDGTPIFDSIASNATAHYLFNEMWIAGKGYEVADFINPHWYATRANKIETFDQVMIETETREGVKLFFAASHTIAPEEALNPIFEYCFEKATVYFGGVGREEKRLEAIFDKGERLDYGLSDNNGVLQKAEKAAAFFNGTGPNVCPIEGTIKHIDLLEKLWSEGSPVKIQKESDLVRTEEMVWGKNNAALLKACYNKASLPED